MTESFEEPFPQNQEAAKRFKGGQKRKQPGTAAAFSVAASSMSPPPTQLHMPYYTQAASASGNAGFNTHAITDSDINTQGNGVMTGNRNTSSGLVYQQPISLQHQQLPTQYLPLNHTPFASSSPDVNGHGREDHVNASAHSYTSNHSGAHAFNSTSNRTGSSEGIANGSISPSNITTADDMDALTTMLSETTLSSMAYYGPSAATIASDFDDEDLWGPQIRSTNTEDVTVPVEMQILPDLATRQHLTDLYYKVSSTAQTILYFHWDMQLIPNLLCLNCAV
ncbi:hypothetical protein BC939DRAFT_211697 [Gamsiella multidivaricata]|uniref:uncharacterized protein n=1 Tax=Gamsiella multidivaricata TaxID=101098 RepID=UPI00221EB699|nr:uncharacterized protein BC939DRAFT_211697 [Gamsiella multidivaricata]KAI7821050.1 hypothetical protein BC939DRAFT_211697 [Gamsiella multidivaricata]